MAVSQSKMIIWDNPNLRLEEWLQNLINKLVDTQTEA